MNDPAKMEELCGAIHLHTIYSDGGVDYPELINASQIVGLDFIIVTDHMSMGGKEHGFEGFHKKLCVITGYEQQDSNNQNHYLVVGTDRVHDEATKPQEYINAVKNNGGIGFLAHPAEKRNYFGNLPPYPWTEWQVQGFDGIEIWNQMSDWVENIKSWMSFFRLFFPRRFIGEVPQELLKKWDDLNLQRFVSGIGGVDAHTRRVGKGLLSMTVFPIKVELKGIRTHVLMNQKLDSQSFKSSKDKIMNSLKNGNAFISNYRRGDARGTRMWIEYADGKTFPPGKNEYKPNLPAKINVTLPGSANIYLINNGKRVASQNGKIGEFKISKSGIYRIEVFRKSKPWIYSNPFPV